MSLLPSLLALASLSATPVWQQLEPGLELAEIELPRRSDHGDSRVTALRADPSRFELRMLGAAFGDGESRTARGWALNHGLVAATNAGMFLPDLRPVGYARRGQKVANKAWPARYKAVLVAGPRDEGLPAFQILDPDCDGQLTALTTGHAERDVRAEAARYELALQEIRMVTCKGKNAWRPTKRRWSSMIAAVDGKGRLLWLHCRSPYAMPEYIEQLLALPLGIERAIYLEGGPEASLYVASGGRVVERVGSFETGFNEDDGNREFWALPNVLGLVRRAEAAPSER